MTADNLGCIVNANCPDTVYIPEKMRKVIIRTLIRRPGLSLLELNNMLRFYKSKSIKQAVRVLMRRGTIKRAMLNDVYFYYVGLRLVKPDE